MSFVGAWMSSANDENATIPILEVLACCSTKSEAAASAAWSLLGSISVEHMLPDTSIVSRMVDPLVGTAMTAAGRATANASAAMAPRNRTNGRWRRMRDVPGPAAAMSDRLE